MQEKPSCENYRIVHKPKWHSVGFLYSDSMDMNKDSYSLEWEFFHGRNEEWEFHSWDRVVEKEEEYVERMVDFFGRIPIFVNFPWKYTEQKVNRGEALVMSAEEAIELIHSSKKKYFGDICDKEEKLIKCR